ncbi:tigger transposable element-derived protein 4-like [Octopus sinensis]|uniref:Tigger transposable element-derived protein 4-like n=1 Tax=Octopus sinensis TaxID=2607531 RepID=A0A6P7TU71_9MOLL|nr:tigger transposable element-derived protein 4-like [Octopus sinensis]
MRKCTRLSFNEKRRIIAYMEENKSLTMDRIAYIFSSVLKKKISRRAVNDLRLGKEKIMSTDPIFSNKKRLSNLTYSVIDTELLTWMEYIELRGGFLDDNSILLKAKNIANIYGIKEFKASNGWLSKFKIRNNLKLRTLHGESGSIAVDQKQEIDAFTSLISAKIQQYNAENIYNADETGIFYKSIPSKSVSVIALLVHHNAFRPQMNDIKPIEQLCEKMSLHILITNNQVNVTYMKALNAG